MSIKSWDSLKRILKMKILQCQDYVNINDLTSRISLSLWHYNCFFFLKFDLQNLIMRFDNATIALQRRTKIIFLLIFFFTYLCKIFHLWIFFSSVNFLSPVIFLFICEFSQMIYFRSLDVISSFTRFWNEFQL